MFHYSCIGCDYHCSITVEEKNGKCEVSTNCCSTGANFAMMEFKKNHRAKQGKSAKSGKNKAG